MDIREYVAEKGITVTVERDRGAQVDQDGWEHHAYVLALHNASTGETWSGAPWRQGYGVETVPQDEPADVFDAIVRDVETVVGGESFEQWAGELGYEPDSLAAYRVYETCRSMAEALERLVGGADELNHIVWNVERLA